MSLFPAYGGGQPLAAGSAKEEAKPEEATATGANWKNNESYIQKHIKDVDIATQEAQPDSSSSSEDSEEEGDKEKQEDVPKTKEIPRGKPLEFDASDEFYVDKKSNSSYRNISTLTKPTRPRYKTRMARLRDENHKHRGFSRADSKLTLKNSRYVRKQLPVEALSEEEVARLQEQLTRSKVLVQREPEVLDHWLELHRLLNLNLDKANRLAVAEHQLHTLETALEHHPSNQQILRLYTDVANATYQASEVAARFEKMLKRNPFEYILWTNLIMVTQGNMARCRVPAVLQIYAYSMRRMHVGHTDEITRRFETTETDVIMLKLFHNCLLFLRQSGNINRMFSVIRLSMELNFPGLTMNCLEASAANEAPLIEFEEMVLGSGMPMPEIWTRVEKLRQAYCFLPYPILTSSSIEDFKGEWDTERYMFSDDIVPYAHALKSPGNRLHLLLVVVQLTKMPLIRSCCLANKLNPCIEEFGETEAIEMLFAVLADRHSYAVSASNYADCDAPMMNLAKEMSVTPSFMPHFVGHDVYADTVSTLILKCSEAFSGEETKRRTFLILWLRFQRLLIVLHKLMGKLTKSYVKDTRNRIREEISKSENREVVRFYTELALCEFEGQNNNDNDWRFFSIFWKIITEKSAESSRISCPDIMHLYIVCAELLIQNRHKDRAIDVLVSLCVETHIILDETSISSKEVIVESIKSGIKLVNAELKALDAQPAEMALEEYFMPNRLLILLRALSLLDILYDPRNLEVKQFLSDLQQKELGPEAARTSERKRFLREQVMEIQLLQLQLSISLAGDIEIYCGFSERKLEDLLERGLEEFPRNMVFLQHWTNLKTILWHKQRARFIRTKAGIASLAHLVIAAHSRVQIIEPTDTFSKDAIRVAVRNRLINLFEAYLPTNSNRSEIEEEQYRALRRNSIYWRLYMTCLSDTNATFQRSREVLLMAIDECPWDKALLMEGGKVLPNELSFLQDLMTEKEIRIFAVPEELGILRDQ
ncbi:nuclear exosome regulator NRDE2 isoform X1 [Drosophila santomea]|uniref:nuclear exosome regulator NRDE2 isoform X1 n=2 Tax=Drosophila santomea TaxID=129105 RepID=UPI0019546FB6|nr:nuclear exosome regulator NRDE2 isoform X1 [Drosophila santomea]